MPARSLIVSILLCAAAGRCAAHGGLEDQTAVLDAAIQKAPGDAEKWFERCCVFLSFGDWRRALEDAARVEALAPGRYPVAFARGRALAGSGQWAGALSEFNTFLAQHPGHAPASVARARVLMKLQRPVEAVTDYRTALAKTASPEPDLYLELTDVLTGSRQFEEARVLLENGICKLGRLPSLEMRAIELAVAQGRTDEALKRVEVMQAAAPRPEPWMARRAEILAGAGRKDEAQQAWLALSRHLASQPAHVRSSHAMCLLAERAASHLPPSPSGASAPVPVKNSPSANTP